MKSLLRGISVALLVLALSCLIVIPANAQESPASGEVTAAAPEWSFTGVDVSAGTVVSGEDVAITPRVSGDLGGATYNYVWVRDGSWKAGEWSSTALDTGSYTSEATGAFTQRRAGTYTIYVDVMDRTGVKRTMSTTVTVTSPDWSFDGIDVSATSVVSGEDVAITPRVSGDLGGATYNYVWVRDGSWKAGEWSSTALETGSYTSDRSWAFSTVRAGTYTIYVDVLDRAGVKRTMSTTVVVRDDTWAVDGIDASCGSSFVELGGWVTISPKLLGDTEGMTFNYVWCHNGSWKKGEWGSTALDSGSYTTNRSASFKLDKPGTYILYVDCLSRRGEKRTVEVRVTAYNGYAAPVINASYRVGSPGVGLCAAWVSNVFNAAGDGWILGDACDMYWRYCFTNDRSLLMPGMIVAVPTEPYSEDAIIYGHVGIYIGNNTVRHSVSGVVKNTSFDYWCEFFGVTSTVKWGWLGNIALK